MVEIISERVKLDILHLARDVLQALHSSIGGAPPTVETIIKEAKKFEEFFEKGTSPTMLVETTKTTKDNE